MGCLIFTYEKESKIKKVKFITISFIVLLFLTIGLFNLNVNVNKNEGSLLTLANIEALAQSEGGG